MTDELQLMLSEKDSNIWYFFKSYFMSYLLLLAYVDKKKQISM